MIVTVHCGSLPGAASGAGRVQPLTLSNPLCSAHQAAAAFSAAARVAAVNALQYLAFFNMPSVSPAAHLKKSRRDRHAQRQIYSPPYDVDHPSFATSQNTGTVVSPSPETTVPVFWEVAKEG